MMNGTGLKTTTISVPEWDADPILIREPSLGAMMKIMKLGTDHPEFIFGVVAICVVGEDGNPRYTVDELMNTIGASRMPGFAKVFSECAKFAGVSSNLAANDKGDAAPSP